MLGASVLELACSSDHTRSVGCHMQVARQNVNRLVSTCYCLCTLAAVVGEVAVEDAAAAGTVQIPFRHSFLVPNLPELALAPGLLVPSAC